MRGNKIPKENKIRKKNVVNSNEPKAQERKGFAFDTSFDSLYYGVKVGEFTNYLSGEQEFIAKFKEVREFIPKVCNKEFGEDLIRCGRMRHCHKVEGDKIKIVRKCIESLLLEKGVDSKRIEDIIEQHIGQNENLYQIGFEGGIRYIGVYLESYKTFKLFLIDYHHKLYPDERRNKLNLKGLKYCPMRS